MSDLNAFLPDGIIIVNLPFGLALVKKEAVTDHYAKLKEEEVARLNVQRNLIDICQTEKMARMKAEDKLATMPWSEGAPMRVRAISQVHKALMDRMAELNGDSEIVKLKANLECLLDKARETGGLDG